MARVDLPDCSYEHGGSRIKLDAYFNIVNALIGSSFLALPIGFEKAGIMSGLALMGVLVLSIAYSVRLLMHCKHARPAGAIVLFDDVGFAAFGQAGRNVANVALVLSQVGFVCSYLVFAAENFYDVLRCDHGGCFLSKSGFVIALAPMAYVLVLIRSVDKLAMVSFLALISIVYSIAVVYYDGSTRGQRLHWPWDVNAYGPWLKWATFPDFFGIAVFSFCCQAVAMSMAHSIPSDNCEGEAEGPAACARAECSASRGGRLSNIHQHSDSQGQGRYVPPLEGSVVQGGSLEGAGGGGQHRGVAIPVEGDDDTRSLLGHGGHPALSTAKRSPYMAHAHARSFLWVLDLSLITVGIIYASFGALGYMFYGSSVRPSVTENLAHGFAGIAVRVGLSLMCIMSIPVQLFPVTQLLEKEAVKQGCLSPEDANCTKSFWKRNAFRFLIVACPSALAVGLPCFTMVCVPVLFSSLLCAVGLPCFTTASPW
eukprot:jgi/Mesvir1/23774/Mv10599-RA.1